MDGRAQKKIKKPLSLLCNNKKKKRPYLKQKEEKKKVIMVLLVNFGFYDGIFLIFLLLPTRCSLNFSLFSRSLLSSYDGSIVPP